MTFFCSSSYAPCTILVDHLCGKAGPWPDTYRSVLQPAHESSFQKHSSNRVGSVSRKCVPKLEVILTQKPKDPEQDGDEVKSMKFPAQRSGYLHLPHCLPDSSVPRPDPSWQDQLCLPQSSCGLQMC